MKLVKIVIVLMILRSVQRKDPEQQKKKKAHSFPLIIICAKVVCNISKCGEWQCKGNLLTFPRAIVYSLECYALEKNVVRRVFKMR